MRQAGILAAAGLHALNHNVERLSEDHAKARRLARGLAELPGFGVDLDACQTNMVFVVVDGKAEQRQLELGLLNGSYVEVLSGVTATDQVIVVGQSGLKNGTLVKVVNAENVKAAAAG